MRSCFKESVPKWVENHSFLRDPNILYHIHKSSAVESTLCQFCLFHPIPTSSKSILILSFRCAPGTVVARVYPANIRDVVFFYSVLCFNRVGNLSVKINNNY